MFVNIVNGRHNLWSLLVSLSATVVESVCLTHSLETFNWALPWITRTTSRTSISWWSCEQIINLKIVLENYKSNLVLLELRFAPDFLACLLVRLGLFVPGVQEVQFCLFLRLLDRLSLLFLHVPLVDLQDHVNLYWNYKKIKAIMKKTFVVTLHSW